MEYASNLPKGLQAFIDHYEQTRKPEDPSINGMNLYLIQTEDMDGNITDEKYGINLVTDVGLAANISNLTDYYVYFESVNNTSSYVSSVMPDYIPEISAKTTRSLATYPMTYDSVSGMISQRWKIATCELDYNITGITSDVTFTGFGIKANPIASSNRNAFIIRVTIYDSEGVFSSITKHLNEKLKITFFCSASMHEDIINDAYTNGIQLFTRPDNVFNYATGILNGTYCLLNRMNSDWRLGDYNTPTYKTYISTDYDTIDTSVQCGESTINDALYAENPSFLKISPTVIEDKGLSWSYLLLTRGFNFMIARDLLMTTPEELSVPGVYTNSHNSGNLDMSFGDKPNPDYAQYTIPATDFNMTDSKMYNYLTNDWDIQDTFTNASSAWYGNPWSFVYAYTNYLYMNDENGNASTACVYVNPKNSIPITSFTYTKPSVNLYMTDKYWDPSTWVRVLDPSNIDATLQTKKYIVVRDPANANSNAPDAGPIVPTRQQTVHSITPSKAPYTISGITSNPVASADPDTTRGWFVKPLTSTTSISWILSRDDILFIDSGNCDYQYHLYGDTNDSEIDPATFRYSFDDTINNTSKIVVAPSGRYIPSNVRIYTVSAYGVQPTFVDIPVSATTIGTNNLGHYTKSENGYIGIANENDNTASVIDVNNATELTFTDVSLFHVQEFTNYAIYLVTNSAPQQWVVYDLSTQTVVQTFNLPAEYTYPVMIYGCGRYVYLADRTSNINHFFLYDITTNTLSSLPSDFIIPCIINTRATYDWYRQDRCNSYALYHSDGMIVCCDSPRELNYIIIYVNSKIKFINFTTPAVALELYKYGSLPFQTINGNSRYLSYTPNSAEYLGPCASIVTSADGKHVLLVNAAFGRASYSTVAAPLDTNYVISDFGYALKTMTSINQACSHYEPITTSSKLNGSWGGMLYFDNGIVVMDGFGQCKWYPLEYMLPHKVTGTTRTYQFYNNPKQIFTTGNTVGFTSAITNRGNITRKPQQEPVDENGNRWYSGMRWGTNSSNYITRSVEQGTISSNLIRVPVGSTITVQTTLDPNVIFDSTNTSLKPELQCQIQAYEDTNTNNKHRLYTISGAMTNNDTYTLTLPGSVTSPTGYVYIAINIYHNASSVYWLTTTMFTTKTITITPPA